MVVSAICTWFGMFHIYVYKGSRVIVVFHPSSQYSKQNCAHISFFKWQDVFIFIYLWFSSFCFMSVSAEGNKGSIYIQNIWCGILVGKVNDTGVWESNFCKKCCTKIIDLDGLVCCWDLLVSLILCSFYLHLINDPRKEPCLCDFITKKKQLDGGLHLDIYWLLKLV